jgi:hypothetical protein
MLTNKDWEMVNFIRNWNGPEILEIKCIGKRYIYGNTPLEDVVIERGSRTVIVKNNNELEELH